MIYNFGPVLSVKNTSIIVPNCNIQISPNLSNWVPVKASAIANPMYEIFYADNQWFFVIKQSCYLKVNDTYTTDTTYEFSTALVGGGGKGGSGNGAPAVDPRQAGGSGGGGGAVKLYTDYSLTPNVIYQINIGAGATTLNQGGNTFISESNDSGNNFTQIYIANGGYSGKNARYANEGVSGSQYPLVSNGGNNGDNSTTIGTGGSSGTNNKNGTNGLNGTLLFANNYFNTKWENKYYGSGGGGGSGGYYLTAPDNPDIKWLTESSSYGTGGLDSGGRGSGQQQIENSYWPSSFYGVDGYGYWDSSGTWQYYSRRVAKDITILPSDIVSLPGVMHMGGGGGGGGSCNGTTSYIDSNNKITYTTYGDVSGSNGGDGVVIFQLIKK